MGKQTPDYVPDKSELNYRAKAVQWFSLHKWDDAVADRIMYHEDPPISVVERLVRRHGPVKAYEIIKRMMQ